MARLENKGRELSRELDRNKASEGDGSIEHLFGGDWKQEGPEQREGLAKARLQLIEAQLVNHLKE